MSWDHVLLDVADNIAFITLNRPERMNAFGGKMRQEIVEVLEGVAVDKDVRVVVITGAGKAFCTGGDIEEFASGSTQALAPSISSDRHAMCKAVLAINKMEKPVIAAVNGIAAGGGCNLALSCDIRIASEKARFSQIFTKRGVHPDWGGIYFLPRLVGYAKAAELIFSAEIIDAAEALRIGLVNKVILHEGFESTIRQYALRMAKNAPIPIAFAKRGLQNFQHWDLSQALDYEAYVLEVCMKSKDIIEGFTAFLEKREPIFKGN
jgi:2-(1,2-epoxy-1,2-dihydrophenyl)acetyl-CoA isomerase